MLYGFIALHTQGISVLELGQNDLDQQSPQTPRKQMQILFGGRDNHSIYQLICINNFFIYCENNINQALEETDSMNKNQKNKHQQVIPKASYINIIRHTIK